jgi:hypothetical protein
MTYPFSFFGISGTPLKIEHLCLGHQINKMGCAIEHHVGKEFRLVNLTGICARRSDPDGNLFFEQVRKIVAGAVSGDSLFREIPGVVGPQCAVFDEKDMDIVSFFMGNFGELKTSCC